MSKLDDLVKIEVRTEEDLLQEATFEGVAKGICTNPNCNYTCDVEPDQDKGYCELCDTNTVSSCLVLADII